MCEYHIDSRAYLRRAKELLLSSQPADLFYAAFELRCCVESRQQQYADYQQDYIKTKTKAHKLSETKAKLAKIYNNKKICHLQISFNGPNNTHDIFYTPVSDNLVKSAEKLGDFLHAMKSYRKSGDIWWKDSRERLHALYRQAWIACQGDLWVPPLWDPKTRELGKLSIDARNEPFLNALASSGSGSIIMVKVDYLNTPPANWICDL